MANPDVGIRKQIFLALSSLRLLPFRFLGYIAPNSVVLIPTHSTLQRETRPPGDSLQIITLRGKLMCFGGVVQLFRQAPGCLVLCCVAVEILNLIMGVALSV